MDLGLALMFVFQDPDWIKKVLINGLIGLIPVVGQIYLLGWSLEIARRVALDEYTTLPDMDFGVYLRRGFQAFVAGMVYSLPIWIFVIPIVAIPTVGMAIPELDQDTLGMLSAIVSLCCGGLVFIYSLLMGLFLQVVYAHIAVQDSLGAAFQFSEIFRLLKAAIGPWLLAFVGTMVAGFLASIVGTLACGVGIIFTMALYFPVMGHLYGQAYRQAHLTAAPVM